MAKEKIHLFLKIAVILLLLLQLPFVFEILESSWLRSYLDSQPAKAYQETPFADVKGVIHVHSAAGGHSRGTYPQIIEAAKATGMKWVLMTEHPREPFIFNKIYDPDVVMLYGWEEDREGDGRILRDDESSFLIFSEFEEKAVPEEAGGIEIFNLAESASAHNDIYTWISWLYHNFLKPDMFFFQIWEINRERFDVWDSTLARRHVTATAGIDAHQNLGLILETATGDEIFSLQVDSYETSMKSVSNHLLLPESEEVNEASVVKALKKGSSYICFDLLANPSGFSFHAENQGGVFSPGSTVLPGSNLRLLSPMPVKFRVFQSGRLFRELEGTDFTLPANEPGAYRLEVMMIDPPYMLKDKPWIITNPIYVASTP